LSQSSTEIFIRNFENGDI